MAVRNFTVKFSGTVAYDDNSHGSFESTAIWTGELGGIVSTHSTAASQEHTSQLYADKATELNEMISILGPGVTLSPPAATPDKTVDSFIAELSGSVVYDDGTPNGFFIAQWIGGALDLFPLDSSTHWAAVTSDPVASAFLITALEELTGSGNAALL
jgi:hypothetical protein